VAPANTSSIIVAVTGVLQDPSTYSVSGTTLTFSAAPPSGTSNISVRYLGIPASGVTTTAYRTVTNFTATAGQTSFSVPSYTVGYIDVYRNGVRLVSTDYTATTGTTVVLTNAATAGDTITTISFYVSSVLNAIPATAGSVSTSYLVDGSVTTVKLADANVTQAKLGTGVAGNGPSFSVLGSGNQSFSSASATKVTWNGTIQWDTASCYSAANNRFTPNVAGYYQVNANAAFDVTSGTVGLCWVYKNGSSYKRGMELSLTSGNFNTFEPTISATVYMNGTTDYIEIYVYCAGTSPLLQSDRWFDATLIRSA
jgi:hypothetical protein